MCFVVCILIICFAGGNLTVAMAGSMIEGTKTQLRGFRSEVDAFSDMWYQEVVKLAAEVGVEPSIPRRCGRQTHRLNTLADTPKSYFLRTVTIPFLG